MARPKSENKRKALMDAATRVIVTQGLSAPTATIAQEAGVSNGSLFTYFETKSDLFNALYLDLKSGMATVALEDLPLDGENRDQVFCLWSNWMRWAMAEPDKRRALALLTVSDEITPASRAEGHKMMGPIAQILEKSRANGPMRDVPLGFVINIMNAVADATIDFMVQDAKNAEKHSREGFEAMWRMIA